MLKELKKTPTTPLFVMTHDTSYDFFDQNDKIAINNSHHNLFLHRKSFVFACYTANELGRELGKKGVYWGYTGGIQAPDDTHKKSIEIFASIFKKIIENFSHCEKDEQINEFIHELKNICDNFAYEFDELFENEHFDALDAHRCLIHIWNRLRVWNGSIMFTHPSIDDKSPIFEKLK